MQTKKERTREHILEASYPLFVRDGFNKVTMKDICEAAGLSRGGLYGHFGSTAEIFEAVLVTINQKDETDFDGEMAQGIPAPEILEHALGRMEYEMKHSDDSLSFAMVEYAKSTQSGMMDRLNSIFARKWASLIEYGMRRGEFNRVNVKVTADTIVYVYQGIRVWSLVTSMTGSTCRSIVNNIRIQLIPGVEVQQ